jgi:hypothetical protein
MPSIEEMFTRPHAGQHSADHLNRTKEINLEGSAVICLSLLLDGAQEVDTGVLHERVDRAEVIYNPPYY